MERVNKVLYLAHIFSKNTRDRRKLEKLQGDEALVTRGVHWSRNVLRCRVRKLAKQPFDQEDGRSPAGAELTFLPAFLLRDRHQS